MGTRRPLAPLVGGVLLVVLAAGVAAAAPVEGGTDVVGCSNDRSGIPHAVTDPKLPNRSRRPSRQ
ncbi:MAG: hypothetical protein V5A62_15905 [Haloarculaceae archaeon]